MTLIFQGFRGIVFILDMIVYSLVGSMYQIFMFLAGVTTDNGEPFNIVSDTFIELISKRIYAFLFLFMVFKISITALNYIANPDTLSNAEKGIKNLFKRILFTLALIILLPTVFSISKIIQNEIIVGNVIPSILSTSVTDVQNDGTTLIDTSEIGNIGNEVAFTLFESFFTPNCDIPTSKMCSESTKIKKDINENRKSGKDTEIAAYLLSVGETEKEDGKRYFIFNYSVLLSTAVGLFVVWVLLVFCFDLGIRMIKLAVLEVIHPIVVMSYLNPKSKYFSNWVKEYISTYMTIFIRLFIMFFIIFLISVIQLPENAHPAMYPFIVLSIFMAAKQIPEMIKKIFNITSKFSMNPFSRLSQAPLIGNPLQKGIVAGGLATAAGLKALPKVLGKANNAARERHAYNRNQGLAQNANTPLYDRTGSEVNFDGLDDKKDERKRNRFEGLQSGEYMTEKERDKMLKKQKNKDKFKSISNGFNAAITGGSFVADKVKVAGKFVADETDIIDGINKALYIAEKAANKDGMTIGSIRKSILENDPLSTTAIRDAKKRAKQDKIKKTLNGKADDMVIQQSIGTDKDLRARLTDDDGKSLFKGIEKSIANAVELILDDHDLGNLPNILKSLSSKQMADISKALPDILQDISREIASKSASLSTARDKRDEIKLSDTASNSLAELLSNEIRLKDAKEGTNGAQYTALNNSLQNATGNERIEIQNKMDAIRNFENNILLNTTEVNQIQSMEKREVYAVQAIDFENEIKAIEKKQENATELSRNISKSQRDVAKARAHKTD